MDRDGEMNSHLIEQKCSVKLSLGRLTNFRQKNMFDLCVLWLMALLCERLTRRLTAMTVVQIAILRTILL